MTVHRFRDDLAWSHQQSDQPWWENVYRQAFPTFAGMVCVRKDGWAQRGGIDRVITLSDGTTLKVDEKVRREDYDDILLERWSDLGDERRPRTPGWVQKPLTCDFIAYAFVPSSRCYLLPFQTLRRAWRQHGHDWIRWAERSEHGFRVVHATNPGYVTQSIAVPVAALMEGMTDAMLIRWNPEAAAA
jgi:hypothetical protein